MFSRILTCCIRKYASEFLRQDNTIEQHFQAHTTTESAYHGMENNKDCELCMHTTISLFQDLIDDLKYELTGKFERLIIALMRPPAYHDAKEMKDAVKVQIKIT